MFLGSTTIFIEIMDWMQANTSMNNAQTGKLNCWSCGGKLGQFSWFMGQRGQAHEVETLSVANLLWPVLAFLFAWAMHSPVPDDAALQQQFGVSNSPTVGQGIGPERISHEFSDPAFLMRTKPAHEYDARMQHNTNM